MPWLDIGVLGNYPDNSRVGSWMENGAGLVQRSHPQLAHVHPEVVIRQDPEAAAPSRHLGRGSGEGVLPAVGRHQVRVVKGRVTLIVMARAVFPHYWTDNG